MDIELPFNITQKALPLFLEKNSTIGVANIIQSAINRYGNLSNIKLKIDDLGVDGLSIVYGLAKEDENRSLMMRISSYKNILEFPFSAKIGNLNALVVGLKKFILENSIDGWLYHKEIDGVFLPWLVTSITLERGKQLNNPFVLIKMSANVAKKAEQNSTTTSIMFDSNDIVKKTIPELLSKNNYFHETPELKANYEIDLSFFAKYRNDYGVQFRGSGMALSNKGYSQKGLIKLVDDSKMVNDEEEMERTIIEEVDARFWEENGNGKVFSKQPYHCRFFMFHLSLHENIWIHVSFVTPYIYQPEIREKLILPTLHRDLIDILTEDMDVIMEDFVEGKSGGTTILCKGRPGLGKTLTAEVYSEVIKKPLYRVHSGQLGTTAESVEKEFGKILNRASRWGAILLLDEADVFIRRRDNDVQHNAVVASFLRVLEYFNGLMFMTTNRENDIDDAILSRCIAIINFDHPSKDDSKKIWRVLADQFKVELSDDLIDKLADQFDKASGRDIKELLKLTSKFSRRKGVPLDVDIFRQCAMFRGVL